eukprot:8063739-Karenia_brevis.AAC.1
MGTSSADGIRLIFYIQRQWGTSSANGDIKRQWGHTTRSALHALFGGDMFQRRWGTSSASR